MDDVLDQDIKNNTDPSKDTSSVSRSPESAPYIERAPSGETIPSETPHAPKPQALKEESDVGVSTPDSRSQGRVVDRRAEVSRDGDLSNSIDEDTRYADKEEKDFIKGVQSAHGSDES